MDNVSSVRGQLVRRKPIKTVWKSVGIGRDFQPLVNSKRLLIGDLDDEHGHVIFFFVIVRSTEYNLMNVDRKYIWEYLVVDG